MSESRDRVILQDLAIAGKGIGMAIGSAQHYHPDDSNRILKFSPHNALKGQRHRTGIKRQELFRLFAPIATCKASADRPSSDEELSVRRC